MQPLRPILISATGDVAGAANGGLASVLLTPAAAVSRVDVRQNGAAGGIIVTMQAAANGESVKFGPFRFEGQLHITLTGASAFATVLT